MLGPNAETVWLEVVPKGFLSVVEIFEVMPLVLGLLEVVVLPGEEPVLLVTACEVLAVACEWASVLIATISSPWIVRNGNMVQKPRAFVRCLRTSFGGTRDGLRRARHGLRLGRRAGSDDQLFPQWR